MSPKQFEQQISLDIGEPIAFDPNIETIDAVMQDINIVDIDSDKIA